MQKKIIAAAVSLVTAVALVTGCANIGSKEDSAYKEFITVDVYDDYANYQGLQTGWFAKIVKDKFNMELNIIAPNVSGGGKTTYQSRAAAGDLGDLVVISTDNGRVSEAISAGLIMDASQLMEGKDIMTTYGQAVEATNDNLDKDGIYAFPSAVSSGSPLESQEGLEPTFGPYIRWDYYKALGYPAMDSLDDMLDVLEDMQAVARETEGDDSIYALSFFSDWDDNMMNNAKQIACMYGYDEVGFELLSADGSDRQSILDDDSLYIKALRFFYEANKRGLVDPDSSVQNYSTWSEKYSSGKTLFCPWPWICQSNFNVAQNLVAGKGYMLAPVNDMNILSYGNYPDGDPSVVICIGSNAQDPQRMADFIDWLYSPEGVRLNGQTSGAAGIEGLTWERGEDGLPQLTEYGKKALPDNDVEVPEEYGGGSWKDGGSKLNFKTVNTRDIDPDTGETYAWESWSTTLSNEINPLAVDWQEYMGASSSMEYLKENDMITVSAGTAYSIPLANADITTIREQCKSAIVGASWEMIFAESDEEFEEMLAEMKRTAYALGFEQVLEVDNQNADDFDAARQAMIGAQ